MKRTNLAKKADAAINKKTEADPKPVKTTAVLKKDKIKKKETIRLSKFQENLIYMMSQFKLVQRGSIELNLDFKGTIMKFKMNKTQ